MTDDLKKTGTTILGIVCKDGVVIATERRATMGTLIAHKATKKLYQIDNNRKYLNRQNQYHNQLDLLRQEIKNNQCKQLEH